MIIPPEGLILNVYKPPGLTSFDVVRIIRRRLNIKKAGHGGTLDPIAEGVLLILLGKATKRAGELLGLDKKYRAGILLGKETDTYDITGKVISEQNCSAVTLELLDRVIAKFTGKIEQIPPMFSAVKVEGRKLYKLARKGIEIERAPRTVNIYTITITGWSPPHLQIDVHCSKGTYIRTLAHDIGAELECGACMDSLIRTSIGGYKVEESIRLDDIQ
ncbi:tRNA pseudouridine(55) synthase TruB [bacterium]|nr:tRNA pseudouridine(55) synthase TruB [bacterium]